MGQGIRIMSHVSMAEFVEQSIEYSDETLEFLTSRKDVLDRLVVQDVYMICCREAQHQFEYALKAWHKNPDSGMYLMLSNHYGAQHLVSIWRTVLEYFEAMPSGPTLETMLEAIKSLGLDPRIQFASAECRSIICRFIVCQTNPEATVKSWIKNSRAIADKNSFAKYAHYLHIDMDPDECRQYIMSSARKYIDKYEAQAKELTKRFNHQCDELTRTSRSFRVGNTLLTDLHAQVSREWLRTYATRQKLKKEWIRANDKLVNQEHKSKDYSDVMARINAPNESSETAQPNLTEPDPTDLEHKPTSVKRKNKKPKFPAILKITGRISAGYASNIRKYMNHLYESKLPETSHEPENADRPDQSSSKPGMSTGQAQEEKPQCIAPGVQVQKAVNPDVGKPAESPNKPAAGTTPAPTKNAETRTNDKTKNQKINQIPVSPAAHADSSQTSKAPNSDSASPNQVSHLRDDQEINRLIQANINKPPPKN